MRRAAALALFSGESERPNGFGPHSLRLLSPVDTGTPAERASGILSVLLVEDDPSMRFLVKTNLELAGFRVVAAATGQEGLELAAREDPDVVLLDVMLPDVGGFEVAEQLRDVPVVFMSARSSESDLERGRGAGAIDYVAKPFDPIALPERLREDLVELDRGGADRVWALRFGQQE